MQLLSTLLNREFISYASVYSRSVFQSTSANILFNTNDFILLGLLTSTLIYVILRSIQPAYFQQLYAGFLSQREHQKFYDSSFSLLSYYSISIFVLYMVNSALFIAAFSLRIFKFEQILSVFSLSLVFILMAIILKYILMRLIGAVFGDWQAFHQYINMASVSNAMAGMIILPVAAVILLIDESFAVYFVYIGLFFYLFFYMIRFFRAIQIFTSKQVSVFYSFLYLCTLEIIPLLILYRVVYEFINLYIPN